METVIKYGKFQTWGSIVIGASLIVLTLIGKFFSHLSWPSVALLPIAALQLGRGLHFYYNGFARLGAHCIIKTGIIPEKIYWSDITRVRKFAGDWIITYNKDKEMFFIPGMLAPDSWQDVETYMLELAERKAVTN